MFKFLHLMGGTTFFGIMIAAFFYLARSLRQGDRALIHYSLKASYFGDGLIAFIIAIQLITAIKLIADGHFTLTIPWIIVAFHAFGAVILLWFIILLIKILYFSKTNISSTAINIFYFLNTILFLIFIIIIHDAVTQSTLFDFLFRK